MSRMDKSLLSSLREIHVRTEDANPERTRFIKFLADFIKDPYRFEPVPAQPPQPSTDYPLTESQQMALAIMGPNVLQLSDVEMHFKVRYTDEERGRLSVIPWSSEELESCKSTHVLFPGYLLSLNELRSKVRKAFDKGQDWYNQQAFANEEKVELAWHLIRRDILPGSTSKIWTEQEAMVPKNEHIPDAATFAFGIVLFWKTRKMRLYQHVYARTSSTSSGGDHVLLGYFDEQGLRVNFWSYDYALSDFGLLCARNLPKR